MEAYTISQISEMFQLPVSTIRYYEETGILTNIDRTSTGKRIFTEQHVNRLKTICCFKNTGMTIAQLKMFFTFESSEFEHIDDILSLLNGRKESVSQQIKQLQTDYAHVLRKLRYYEDIKNNLSQNLPLPQWEDYKDTP